MTLSPESEREAKASLSYSSDEEYKQWLAELRRDILACNITAKFRHVDDNVNLFFAGVSTRLKMSVGIIVPIDIYMMSKGVTDTIPTGDAQIDIVEFIDVDGCLLVIRTERSSGGKSNANRRPCRSPLK